MSDNVVCIGTCKGCNKPGRLEDGVCQGCLNHPKRGRKWADMSFRCRTEPEFALAVYLQIKTEKGKEMFVEMYGLPAGAERALGTPVRLVQ